MRAEFPRPWKLVETVEQESISTGFTPKGVLSPVEMDGRGMEMEWKGCRDGE